MKKFLILVHSGVAHMDEFLFIALVLINKKIRTNDALIIRAKDDTIKNIINFNFNEINQESDMIDDEAMDLLKSGNYIIGDVGGRYDGIKYFDHHQDRALPSAAKLYYDNVFSEKGKMLSVFTDIVSSIDTSGPVKTLEKFSINEKYFTLFKRFEMFFVRKFEILNDFYIRIFVEFIKYLMNHDKIDLDYGFIAESIFIHQVKDLIDIDEVKYPKTTEYFALVEDFSKSMKNLNDRDIATIKLSRMLFNFICGESAYFSVYVDYVKSLLSHEDLERDMVAFWKSQEIVALEKFNLMYMSNNDPKYKNITIGSLEHAQQYNIVASLNRYPNRDAVCVIVRYDNICKSNKINLDFNKLKGTNYMDKITFIHNNGFLVSFKEDIDVETFKEIILVSIC